MELLRRKEDVHVLSVFCGPSTKLSAEPFNYSISLEVYDNSERGGYHPRFAVKETGIQFILVLIGLGFLKHLLYPRHCSRGWGIQQ